MTEQGGDSDVPSTGRPRTTTIQFTMRADHLDAATVHLVGEFNQWSKTAEPMTRQGDSFVASIELATGRMYRYKYLIDGLRWENDWNADSYAPNEYGGDDSVLDLTGGAEGCEPAEPAEPTQNDPVPAPDDPDSPGAAIDDRDGDLPEPNEPG